MTRDDLQLALTFLVLVGNVIWGIGVWRGRADRDEASLPLLAARLQSLEEGRAELEARLAEYHSLQVTVNEIKARLEVVATRSHETINRMNALPETLSTMFLRKDVADVIIRESAEDRGRLHRKYDELRAILQRPTIVKRQSE